VSASAINWAVTFDFKVGKDSTFDIALPVGDQPARELAAGSEDYSKTISPRATSPAANARKASLASETS
jgi:hypothetical protein